ncbi:unnamed protein product [Rhizoctonia solani]|uniref:Mitochondrial intermembrane space cysteine motif-containing protein MIX17 n=3 Tax=Rhizoctonia solani TaxID=456999 RepID=A0A8H3DKF4_9AGAM|nr:MIC17 protein, putative [Rhizoctonia solani AG-3 Rhs1AP]KEP45786.1 putative MIC17 protein [Rhizoctonia solani 123E]CAE6529828.1 unnamed protein product [Rhizoctonia solani]
MPRQSRSRPAARPASSSSSSSPFSSSSGQTRQASTAAYPPQNQAYGAHSQAQAQQRQPGLLAQMAATASSVAVGSTVGHGLSNMLFGGRSEAPVEQQAPPQQQQQYAPQNSGLSCDFQAKEFTKCMEQGDINTCGWYLDQLKACQAAARPY